MSKASEHFRKLYKQEMTPEKYKDYIENREQNLLRLEQIIKNCLSPQEFENWENKVLALTSLNDLDRYHYNVLNKKD